MKFLPILEWSRLFGLGVLFWYSKTFTDVSDESLDVRLLILG